jgi:hypothetical protein
MRGLISMRHEPDFQSAVKWWPELTNLITPVGWRDHLHRFNIVYDGTILIRPLLKSPNEQGQIDPCTHGVQLAFAPATDMPSSDPKSEERVLALPNGSRVGDQFWLENPAPVLCTRWINETFQLTQTVFSHLCGGSQSRTGTEALFAWIRLEVSQCEQAGSPSQCGFIVRINALHLGFDMIEAKNLMLHPGESVYPIPLHFEKDRLVQSDGLIRLGIVNGDSHAVRFNGRTTGVTGNSLQIALPRKVGARVDLLLPMLPCDATLLDEEQSLGWNGAMAQANAFWAPRPISEARVCVPEPQLNAAILHNIRLARMLTITVPTTQRRSFISGSMVYSRLWATPTSMVSHMLLDPLGWHDEVDKYLEIHRLEQGTIKPPGPVFPQHPGYFGVPEALDAGYQWLTDHGATLYAAVRHAMLTGNEAFIQRWTTPILLACDFIRDCRRLPRPQPQAQGVMPAATASDHRDPIQSFWSDAWNYKGLAAAVRLLRLIAHPHAEEWHREAEDYRRAIVSAMRHKAPRMPRWTDRSGRERGLVPMVLTDDDSNGVGISHPFYLDTGPIFGVYAGVFAADDPLMKDAADFFREAPHVPAEPQPFTWTEPAYFVHEMSSAEPCYSWNVFHSHQLADRDRYLECMYSLFAGGMSRQTFVSCETRGGITENAFVGPLAAYLVRLAVIDDEIEPNSLHLLRLCPLAWVSSSEYTCFEKMPTEFGTVTLKWQLSRDGHSLVVVYQPEFRRQPRATILHLPPVPQLSQVVVNGREMPIDNGLVRM